MDAQYVRWMWLMMQGGLGRCNRWFIHLIWKAGVKVGGALWYFAFPTSWLYSIVFFHIILRRLLAHLFLSLMCVCWHWLQARYRAIGRPVSGSLCRLYFFSVVVSTPSQCYQWISDCSCWWASGVARDGGPAMLLYQWHENVLMAADACSSGAC